MVWNKDIFWSVVKIVLILILFLFSIDLLGEAFKNIGINAAESMIFATSNPYIALFIGLLITALIQSSSTSTSLIVALVASGSITIPNAIPMIMGANIGTTITSTIVSLGFITRPNEFRKALSAAIVHDFFNIGTVLVLFPLEINYGILSNASIAITEWILPAETSTTQEVMSLVTFSPSLWLVDTIGNSLILIAVAFILLFGSIKFLADNISDILIGKSKDRMKRYFFQNPLKSFAWGTLLTAGIQSSSITTSLVVPLVATSKVNLKNAAAFIMGANIGTTITAFIAAIFKTNAALSIAVAHLLFNSVGVLLFLPIPFLLNYLVKLSDDFGKLVIRQRLAGLLYILLTFFIIPFTLIYFNRESNVVLSEITYERTNYKNQTSGFINIINKKIQDNLYDQWLIFNQGPGYERDSPNEIYNVYRNKNVLFINDKYYFINKENFCWDGQGTRGDHKVCIEKIYPTYQIDEGMSFDSVYVYMKSIRNKNTGDSLYIQEYIDVNDKLLLLKREFDQEKKIILEEKLLSIKDL